MSILDHLDEERLQEMERLVRSKYSWHIAQALAGRGAQIITVDRRDKETVENMFLLVCGRHPQLETLVTFEYVDFDSEPSK